jgi:sigma-E factor negative regulatory protein RseA
MNEELDSQLSAMFDDELSSAECELLARRLSRDGELTARWGRYAVMGAAIRAERGVRLNARVARRVSVLVRSEPALGGQSPRRGAAFGWWRPVAGAAVAAGVAAVSILWLRAQAPDGGIAAGAPLAAAVPVNRATAPAAAAGQADRYIIPPTPRAAAAIVPATELANYVVAHSVYTQPVARGNLLSSFVTNDSGAAGGAAAPPEPPQDTLRDAKSLAH